MFRVRCLGQRASKTILQLWVWWRITCAGDVVKDMEPQSGRGEDGIDCSGSKGRDSAVNVAELITGSGDYGRYITSAGDKVQRRQLSKTTAVLPGWPLLGWPQSLSEIGPGKSPAWLMKCGHPLKYLGNNQQRFLEALLGMSPRAKDQKVSWKRRRDVVTACSQAKANWTLCLCWSTAWMWLVLDVDSWIWKLKPSILARFALCVNVRSAWSTIKGY